MVCGGGAVEEGGGRRRWVDGWRGMERGRDAIASVLFSVDIIGSGESTR